MFTKPNILACTDFSPFSDEALKAAEMIRRKTGGKLDVLHVSEQVVLWDWPPGNGIPEALGQKFETEILSTLKKKLGEQIQACHAQAERHVSLGVAASVIMEESLERKIDLIVLGHKGKQGGRFHVGSLAEKLAAASHVPVLIIKIPFETGKVGALIDPNGPMDDILSKALELQALLASGVTVVSLFPDFEARFGRYETFPSKLLSLTEEEKHQLRTSVKEEIKRKLGPAEARLRVEISSEKKLAYHLLSVLAEEKINVAVMKRHQTGLLEKILIGSETRRMIELFPGNLLILPP